uniref:pyridoxal kinase n=1 Tax=Neurospora crassa TaxID=5141 RepID=Q6MVL1_NEUCS|nr:related to pyridoxal kinase [Neurospora crassa]
MSDGEPPVPDTRVLAVASHVVSGYVGNKIAVFSMQSLGCDVAALNTVQFSNHTGYRQFTGTRVSASEITDLYRGLKQSYLDDFDMMLSGYVPGAPALEAVGEIAKELKEKAQARGKPGSFFWVLDPVMGDNGSLLLSEVKIVDMPSLTRAISVLHERYAIPHIIITSVSLPDAATTVSSTMPNSVPGSSAPTPTPQEEGQGQSQPPRTKTLSVVGSTMTSARQPRAFQISFPAIDCYFSGTGDMFSALMLVRMREAVYNTEGDLTERESWLSDDSVDALDLPLAKAAEKVLASMHEVLTKTAEGMKGRVQRAKGFVDEQLQREKAMTDGVNGCGHANGNGTTDQDGHVDKKPRLDSTQTTTTTTTTNGNSDGGEDEEKTEERIKEEEERRRRKQVEEAEKEEEVQARKRLHLMKSKAAELRLVRHLDSLRHPKVEFRARRIECS